MGDQRRVLLLALSGVRIVDPDLLALGLTLPGFVERGEVIARLPSLGLLTLAAHTPAGWEPFYAELDAFSEADVVAIAEAGWDCVAVSALTARITEAYDLAAQLRDAGVPVVLGGLHVTARPDEAQSHADAVVVGQGEAVWPVLLADCAAGRMRPRYTDGIEVPRFRLEDARTPRFDLIDPSAYDRIPIQTARGCPLDCVFCGASRLLGPFQRKPVSLVAAELEAVAARWPSPFVELADDNTFVAGGGGGLPAMLARHGARWFTETDISVADDPALLRTLAGSGCAQLLIGLESVGAGALSETDTRRWKSSRLDRYAESISRIQGQGISVNGCFVLGFDDDDAGVFERTRDFVRDSGLTEVQITLRTPFPGTALFDQLEAGGRLLEPAPWARCTLFDVTYRPARMSVDELAQGFRWLMKELYGPEPSAARKRERARLYRLAQSDQQP